ncbi:MAG TPA: acetylxylan esterase [Opitutaceae bacterium]|nr:acetylxylan esterase [Opitutaceae bacterium]
MKFRFIPWLFAAFICSQALAQPASTPPAPPAATPARARGPSGPPIKVTADHDDWNYPLGEAVKFTVVAPAGTNLSYTIGPEMMPAEAKTAVMPESGQLVLDGGTLQEPGFLRCVVTATGGGRGLATAAFAREKIKPTQTEPADFDVFWAKAKADLSALPIDTKLTPMPAETTDKHEAFAVDLQNVGTPPAATSRFYGILYVPRGEGPFPAMMSPPGAGVRGPDRDIWGWADLGFIVLYVGIHEVPMRPLPDPAAPGAVPGNYPSVGLQDPNSYYFRRVILGCLRANDFLVTQPKWDHRNLVAYGGSQGGYLSLAAAGLDPRVTLAEIAYPAYCDESGYAHGRPAGWPALKFNDPADTDQQRTAKIATTAYFDSVNFARRIKVPGHYAWGYNDETCPPTTTFSMYNVLTAPKELTIYKEMGHARVPALTDVEHAWLLKQVKAAK